MAWGFRRKHPDYGTIVAVDPERFEKIHGSKTAQRAVIDYLCDIGIALQNKEGKRRVQMAVRGFGRRGRPRWLCFHENTLRAYKRAL